MEPTYTPQEPVTAQDTSDAPAKKLNVSIPAAIVTGAAIIGLAIVFAVSPKGATTQNQGNPSQPQQPTEVASSIVTVRPEDNITENKAAEVIVFEYSDSDCPYCKQFHETMKTTVADYKGSVAWVYRYFPLETLHPNAKTEALALSCVEELGGQGAFWSYLDTIMNVTLSPDAKSNESLATFAANVGVDKNLFTACMKAADTKQIDADIAEAKKIGARGTPFSIAVNTKTGKQTIIPGAVNSDYMKQVIDSLLK